MNPFSRNKTPTEPPALTDRSVSVQAVQKLSEQAGQMVQHVQDLEALVADLQKSNDALRVEVRSLQSIREDLEREVIHLRNERDFFQRSTISMSTQLRTAGRIIAETLRLAEQEQIEQPTAPPLVEDAIRNELTVNPPRPDGQKP